MLLGLATPRCCPRPGRGDPGARRRGQRQAPEAARVDSLFAEWSQPGSPGAAVAVLRDGEIVLERGYGQRPAGARRAHHPGTIFHVASVTKQFTTFAVALLAARGELSLDDDVRDHIPELPDLGHRITLRQLIHHTSGIRDQWELLAMAGWRLDDVITKDHVLGLAVRQRELNFTPGSEHLYSNMGYTLLAEVVERVGGLPFPEWMEGTSSCRWA
jgi:CubicO group peptidase (beta-lactamase class C family)